MGQPVRDGRLQLARRSCPTMGAAIVYYTVFSLAPMLVMVIAIAGLAFGQKAAEGALFDELADLVGHP